MKKNLLLAIASVMMIAQGHAQTDKLWSGVSAGANFELTKNVQRETFPASVQLFKLDFAAMKQTLQNAPDRLTATSSNVIITLPNVEGRMERFQMYEASNFEPALQAQFPDIRAYVGVGLDDQYAQVRLSIDPSGIQTMVFRAGKSTEFMEPYSADRKIYAVYNSSRIKGKLPFTCSTEDQAVADKLATQTSDVAKSSTGVLLTFRLALSCTGEYANYFGATSAAQVALVNAAYNATMTRVNGVFEKDLAIHMNIVASNNNVIFYNPTTDPYSDPTAGSGGAWNAELQNTLTSIITEASYDIGHLFGDSGGGGNAGCIGCVCTNGSKGSGFTSPGDGIPMGDNFDIDYVAHEMGHQFGGNHTFTHGTENNAVNLEPGSGSTIMSYAGITLRNVQAHSDDYFHAGSIQQIQTNMAGKTCPTSTAITHGTPVVTPGAAITIPRSTPFMLTGSATDTGGGALTYCWEQYDDAANNAALCGDTTTAGDNDCIPVDTKTTGPLFRSYDPTTNPTRYFPNMTSIMAGSTTTTGDDITVEALPSVARTLNFRLTVRDNAVTPAGQTNFGARAITIDATRGPLTVTSQNTDGLVWAPGSTQTITWAVNNTNASTGGTNVDILLSTDNGATWTTTLVAATPNDGSQTITVPAVSAAYCRVMVKASASIFFNVNTKNIAIGNYTYQTQNSCTDYPFNLNATMTESSDTSYPGMSLTIPDSYTITDANFYANVTHPNIGQFNLLIMAPWQASLNTAIWYNNVGCTGANMDKWFDTSGTAINCANTNVTGIANAFRPYSNTNISAYPGNNSAGAWLIYFKDAVVDGNAAAARFNTFTIQLCKSVSVPVLATENFGLQDFAIYPNPNNGNFNVQFTSNSGNEIKVGVHDMRGRLVFENTYENTGAINQNLQLTNVQSGIYIVTVQDGEQKEVKKIVVE